MGTSACGIRSHRCPRCTTWHHTRTLARRSKRFGRAVAYVEWQQTGRSRAVAQHAALAAPPYRPTEAVAHLYENFGAPVADLGDYHEFTPLSAHGPGCSGSIPARCNIAASRLGPIAWARTGAAVMQSPLFAQAGAVVLDHAAHAVPCPLCGVTPVDTFHFIAECNHPTIDAWRINFEHSCRVFVHDLSATMARERDRAGHLPPPGNLFAGVVHAIDNVDFDSPDFLLPALPPSGRPSLA